jgi:hypothetical protein
MIHLIAEVLDKQIVDKRSRQAGRADGIVIELREGQPPLVVAVEVSPITLLARFNRRLASWYARWDARLGHGRGTPFRIPWRALDRTGLDLRVDFDAEDTPINAFEKWLRQRIVERIPGS